MNENEKRLDEILRSLSDEIDVSPSKYREAKARYEAVGAWLGEQGSALAPYDPVVYPQGSFSLGTAVKPIGAGDFDVDAVCVLQLPPRAVDQRRLKTLVGDRLKHPDSRYKAMIDPQEGGRRCWTIQYADASKFHLDVLPAIPDDYAWLISAGVPKEWAESAICITDRETWNSDRAWPRSNPKGYVAWFKDRMRTRLDEAKRVLAELRASSVEEIEDFDVRTPLQQLIQILKRHRDVRYNGNEDKPISIIITTLAAQAYSNEANLADAILKVVPRMRERVEKRGGEWWVANPVNPLENFADKWVHPAKAEVFFEWLTAVEREHRHLLTSEGWKNAGEYLGEAFGRGEAALAMARYSARTGSRQQGAAGAPIVLTARKSERPSMPKIELPSKPGKPWKP